jgi:Protein of unknown function (DUF4019)
MSAKISVKTGVFMKIIYSALIAAFIFTLPPAQAQDADKVATAEAAALKWLTLTDAGDYARSWDAAAALFQASISKANWATALANARQPLGSLISRKVKSARFTRSLPGAPEGDYVVIQYDARFENKDSAIETVTPLLEKDGSWKVSGYFIR